MSDKISTAVNFDRINMHDLASIASRQAGGQNLEAVRSDQGVVLYSSNNKPAKIDKRYHELHRGPPGALEVGALCRAWRTTTRRRAWPTASSGPCRTISFRRTS